MPNLFSILFCNRFILVVIAIIGTALGHALRVAVEFVLVKRNRAGILAVLVHIVVEAILTPPNNSFFSFDLHMSVAHR